MLPRRASHGAFRHKFNDSGSLGCICICIHVCMHACMHACMSVSLYVYMYISPSFAKPLIQTDNTRKEVKYSESLIKEVYA